MIKTLSIIIVFFISSIGFADKNSTPPAITTDTQLDELSEKYPEFKRALSTFNQESYQDSGKQFKVLSEHADGKLAFYSKYMLMKNQLKRELYEEALSSLASLEKDEAHNKLLKSELEFTSALILTHTMQSKKALEAWLAFIESYQGQRSEAMRLLHARGFRDRLQSYDGTNILEAQELMSDSHRRLKQGKKADPLTKNQDRIISIMDEIIKKMEEQQKQQQQQQQSGNQQGNDPSNPAQESKLQEGEGATGNLGAKNRGSAKDSWGNLPEKEREKMINELKKKYPKRYRQLLEQYYKSLQE